MDKDKFLKDEWETPQDLFDQLDKEFDFLLDPCCTEENKKCKFYFTKNGNGLLLNWNSFPVFVDDVSYNQIKNGIRVYCNPPYSNYAEWVRKAYDESKKGCTVVMLLPATIGTKIWHEIIFPYASEIRFIEGRVRFTINSKPKGTPRFDSAIVIFRPPEIQGKYKFARIRASSPVLGLE